MYNFSEEEMVILKGYPKEALNHANKQMQSMYNAHKPISSPFKWFCSVCDNYLQKQINQTPKTGNAPAFQQSRLKQQSEDEKYRRTQENWQPGMPVLNHPHNRSATVKTVETVIEWAMNVERNLHDRMLNDPDFHQWAAKYANPEWHKLTPEQQIEGMNEIHIDCTCRDIVDRELDFTSEPIKPKAAALSPTEVKMRAWNNEIIKVAVPKDVIQAKPPTFDEPLGQSNIGDYEDSFDDCY